MSRFKHWGIALLVGVINYFALQGILAALREAYGLSNVTWLLILFPLVKILGDLVSIALQLRRGYFFLEDWVRETIRFIVFYGILTGLSGEFWRNFLGMEAFPDMTFMAVSCYGLLGYERERKRARRGSAALG